MIIKMDNHNEEIAFKDKCFGDNIPSIIHRNIKIYLTINKKNKNLKMNYLRLN